jgi:hypothetical protein
MSRFSKDEIGSDRWHLERIGLVAVIFGLALAPSSRASSISHHVIHASSLPRDLQAWVNFLDAGVTHWASVHAPPITANVRRFMAQELNSPDPTSTPMVTYLEWRRNLDPTRFDHYHPNMGPELQSLLPTTATSTPPLNPSPQTVGPPPDPSSGSNPDPRPDPSPPPSPGSGSGTGSGGTPVPPAIPEPSTLTLALGMIAAGFWWHRRSGQARSAQ